MIKKIAKWLFQNRIHILVWAIFISYETIVIGLVYQVFGNPITYLLHYAIIITFFYCCADGALPWAFENKRWIWWRLPGMFLIVLSTYVILHYLADLCLIFFGIIKNDGLYKFSYQFILKNLYRGSYFFGFSIGYYLLKMRHLERSDRERLRQINLENRIRQNEIEKELVQTQNAFLKAQINPHFLFNTLDFVYHSVHTSPDDAADAIIYLSRMMRFAIESNEQGDFIKIGDEIRHVETLINLYRLRQENGNLPTISCPETVSALPLIPLVVLTLAENMVKHGSFNEHSKPSYINLNIENDNLLIETANTSDRNSPKGGYRSGLKNIETRLKFAYGDAVHFEARDEGSNRFIVSITIPLANLSV